MFLLRLNAPGLGRAFRREFGTPRYVMVAGTNESALRFARELERSESEGVRIIGFLADAPDSAEHHVQLSRPCEVHPIAALREVLRRHIVDEIIFAVNSRVYLDSFGDRPLLTFSATPHDEIQLLIKRATDVAVAGTALVVLWPDMSLVGPRPAVPEEVEQYRPWQRRRLRMRPGLTCFWAVSGRDSLDFETWMRLDMQYIDNWSLGSDWRIILRTIPRVVSGRGAH